jgi:transcriptional regulator with GAF, ATPase, and Fis domain
MGDASVAVLRSVAIARGAIMGARSAWYLQEEIKEARDFGDVVGQSAALRAVLQKVDQLAPTDAPVLLLGETGTGKELLARAIHARWRRRPARAVRAETSHVFAIVERLRVGRPAGRRSAPRRPGRAGASR